MPEDMVGRPVNDLDTPALVVDRRILQHNIAHMQAAADAAGLELRPHIKAHKTPVIAQMQVAAGAAGVTAAKVSEAEAMAEGGVADIFIANEVVGDAKVRRMAALAQRVRLSAVVDSREVAEGYGRLFAAEGLTLDVLLEVDQGAHRCGVPPAEAPALAAQVASVPGVALVGVMAYAGSAYQAGSCEGMRRAAAEEAAGLAHVAATLAAAGHTMRRVSGGCTPTGPLYERGCGLTEIRSGTYVFYDMNQVDLGVACVADVAATILATVISVPAPDRVILDAGSKALATQVTPVSPGCGWVQEDLGAVVVKLNDEHGYLDVRRARRPYRVGDKVQVVPPRICTALNLYDELYLWQDGVVVERCDVTARGCSQ